MLQSYAPVLKNRSFRLLWIGEICSRIGDGFFPITLTWLVLEITNSALALGEVQAATGVATLLFGLIGGAVADRADRKTLMVLSGIFSALFVVLIPIVRARGLLTIPLLAVLGFLLSTVSQFFEPALDATTPNIVSDQELVPANALKTVTRQAAYVVGPLLGGVLIGALGTGNVLYIDAASFLILAATVSLATLPQSSTLEKGSAPGRLFADIREGFVFIRQNKVLLTVILMDLVANLATSTVFILISLFVKQVLNSGAQALGVLTAAAPVGSLLAAGVLGMLGDKAPKGKLIVAGFLVTGVSIALAGSTTQLIQTVACLFATGVGLVMINLPFLTLEQALSPDRLRAKVLSVDRTLSFAAVPIGQGGVGFVIAGMGLVPTFYLVGAVTVACAVAGLLVPELRRET
jgi:MFS family permease